MAKFYSAVIAGTHSGVGKTTWSLALMAFFRKKGFQVQPFKTGPDYIDTGFHHRACRPRKSRNLDRFFLSEDYLRQTFQTHSSDADLSLVEGVMGLYDGRTPLSEEGSTAEMAKLLKLPVFLVIDGSGLARSATALVKGYQSFDPGIDLKGVLINRVAGEGHFHWLKEAVEKEIGIPVLGCLPPAPGITVPERHLGLRTVLEEGSFEKKLEQLAKLLEGRFDEKRFLELASLERPSPESLSPPCNDPVKCRIGVAYDKAFSFYYEDNFDLLREAGAELVFFSPLESTCLPSRLDALYLGGGFPELYAHVLSENESMKSAVRRFYSEGGIIYGECGGLIYLAESLINSEGNEFPMIGLVPGRVRMTAALQNFGYKELECRVPTFLSAPGEKLRSHEFHYSVWEAGNGNFVRPYEIKGQGDGFYDGQILASYQHLHFGQNPNWAKNWVQAAKGGGRNETKRFRDFHFAF